MNIRDGFLAFRSKKKQVKKKGRSKKKNKEVQDESSDESHDDSREETKIDRVLPIFFRSIFTNWAILEYFFQFYVTPKMISLIGSLLKYVLLIISRSQRRKRTMPAFRPVRGKSIPRCCFLIFGLFTVFHRCAKKVDSLINVSITYWKYCGHCFHTNLLFRTFWIAMILNQYVEMFGKINDHGNKVIVIWNRFLFYSENSILTCSAY